MEGNNLGRFSSFTFHWLSKAVFLLFGRIEVVVDRADFSDKRHEFKGVVTLGPLLQSSQYRKMTGPNGSKEV